MAQDSRAAIRIMLDKQESGKIPRYHTGSELIARVELIALKNFNCRRGLVQLQWHTEGKGNKDKQIIDSDLLLEGNVSEGLHLKDNFKFYLPAEPYSFKGHLITIVWSITVKIDVPMARDINEEQPFILWPAEKA